MMQLRPQDWVPVLGFGLLPIIAVFAYKGTVIVLCVMGAAAIVPAVREGALKDIFRPKLILFALVGVAWLVIASQIAPKSAAGITKIAQIYALAALFFPLAWWSMRMSAAGRDAALSALAGGTLCALVLLIGGYLAIGVFDQQLFEIERKNPLSVLYPGFVVMALLFPSLLGFLQKRNRPAVIWLAAVAALALAYVIGAASATVLLAISILGFVLFRKDPWHLPRILALVLVVVTITLPVSMPLVLDRIAVVFVEDQHASADAADTAPLAGSIEHRYRIWRFAADRAAERPFLGWGFNTSRALPGGHELLGEGAELLPLHPHNAVLQIWLELGVPGLLLLCVLLWRVYMPPGWNAFGRRELFIRTMTVTVIFVAAGTTFGVWQSWWLAAMALVMASTGLWHERKDAR